MRKHNINDAYEQMKDLTRNNSDITSEKMNNYISTLNNDLQSELSSLSVENYLGYSNV